MVILQPTLTDGIHQFMTTLVISQAIDGAANMKPVTVDSIFKHLQRQCVPAPLNTPKLIRAFRHDTDVMHKVLDMYAEGKLTEYHMIPGNGHLEF